MTQKPIISYIFALAVLILTLLAVYLGSPIVPKVVTTESVKTQINSVIYNDNYSLKLTNEEKEYLTENPVIKLGIDRAFPPFGSITADGNYIGFSADYMRILEHRLNITFDIYKDAPWAKTMQLAKAGQVDMVSALVETRERSDYLTFTPPFVHNPTIIINNGIKNGYIGSLDNLRGKTIAIENGSYASGEISKKYSDIDLILVKNTGMALSLVSTGQADAYVGNAVTASYEIKKLGLQDLSFSGETEYSSDHSVGINKNKPILASAINKALSSISRNDRAAIKEYWFGMDILPQVTIKTAVSIGSILLGILFLLLAWLVSLRHSQYKLKKSQELIKTQSEIDHLTGLANRRKFYSILESYIKSKQEFTLFFLDLDLFKEVNDSLGHAMGDKLLIETASRINTCIRDGDTNARLGGDEFMVILPGITDVDKIENIASNIRTSLSKPFIIQDNQINITTSIGITSYPNDANNAEQLVIYSDQAMYHSKKKGRNCYSYFDHSMQSDLLNKNSLINDLKVALDRQQFELHYQPIVNLDNNTISKAEALIRWKHPARGFVSPERFIPLAEEIGLINDIGEWVFLEAIIETVEVVKNNKNFQMSINTSPLQYRKNGMNISSWFNQLHAYGLTGRNLVLEITEGVLMETSASVRKNLHQLKDLNIEVAIDDFGTGYSSLSYLKKFDIDYLKIDKSFIQNLTEESDDIALVEAIIMMAHKLGCKVIAEGIETETQKRILADAGCDYGQGYYFSKPVNATQFHKLLESWNSKQEQLSRDTKTLPLFKDNLTPISRNL
ncbi:EAL domain-containing protein [Cocleimonas sp. KMM 6892]|uniref:EAL domain-containing protein n=1 Tax=unclassified Cocleimonas TaxID=2639732 RepID=UPI002DBD9728|nr:MULTISPECIES: EAL domain-containing protein [unclassified Cocleimonas]MEB8432906.1 EAL domain-containing protein [Cocleimonas sp. KMM 6892]MEC4716113.1 EAL domain-containing protein [Cocleimonas sp. KMM 6895]MEC4745574.1 EAL domain-containing protein [Cocleimonas sp. KMM 6896]